jgi:hypothetical protein
MIATIQILGYLHSDCIFNGKWRAGGRIGADALSHRRGSTIPETGWRPIRATG